MDEEPFAGNLGSGQPYIYAHLPIAVGIVMTGIGMEHAIVEASDPALHEDTLWLLGAGIVLWLVSFLVLVLASVPRLPYGRAIALCVGAVVATVLIIALGANLQPSLVLLGIAAVLVALPVLNPYSSAAGRYRPK